ncbi:MAG: hypothetical protein KAK04_04805 [Cyclobacteriaceae bacterium]|nr:hypothetical protein [Cyclobacteriaceae bacterium]
MPRLIKPGKEQNNVDRYSDLIHQIINGKDENDPDYDQLALETCHVAKFICQLDDSIVIVRKSEQPDFIIKYHNRIIGLEHEILVKEESKQKEGSFKDLVKSLQSEYREVHPDKKLLLTIYPSPNLKFRKVDKPRISKEIMILIENFITHDILPENDYIDKLTTQSHSRLDFSCNLGAWWQRNLVSETLDDAIQKKEKKVSTYRENSRTSEQWLLIVIGNVGDSSYEIESIESIRNIEGTNFDKVYLLEDFQANLYEVK